MLTEGTWESKDLFGLQFLFSFHHGREVGMEELEAADRIALRLQSEENNECAQPLSPPFYTTVQDSNQRMVTPKGAGLPISTEDNPPWVCPWVHLSGHS